MKPKQQHDDGGQDLFRARLDNIINPRYELVLLGQAIDWQRFEATAAPLFSDTGNPALPIRLMFGLIILKHMYNLSDEQLNSRVGSRTLISSTSAARHSSGTWPRSIARRSPAGVSDLAQSVSRNWLRKAWRPPCARGLSIPATSSGSASTRPYSRNTLRFRQMRSCFTPQPKDWQSWPDDTI